MSAQVEPSDIGFCVYFGAKSSKNVDASTRGPAYIRYQQQAYLHQMLPGEEFPTRVPFMASLEGPDDGYEQKIPHMFSFGAFSQGKYDRLDFNAYARFTPLTGFIQHLRPEDLAASAEKKIETPSLSQRAKSAAA